MVGEIDKFLRKIVPLSDAHYHDTADKDTETQVVDIDTETEIVDLDFETQEVNLACETQLFESPDCINTQLLDHADDEVAADNDDDGSDRTEVLEYSGRISDNDSLSRGTTQLSGEVNIHRNKSFYGDEENGSVRSCKVLIEERRSTGFLGGFTSVRTAAFRASGLAARNACAKVTNSDSRSGLTNCHSSDQGTTYNEKKECYVGEEVDQLRHEKAKGKKIVKKLFGDDDFPTEPEGDSQNMLAPLSYVGSQEPEEALQANALSFVERFINDNCLEFQDESDHRKSSAEKLKDCSSARSLQILAKKTGNRTGSKEAGIYDWDDNREDEGGGDILCRRKEEFFGNESGRQRSLSVPMNPQGERREGRGKKNESENSINKSSVSVSEPVGRNNLENEKKITVSGMKSIKNSVNRLKRQLKGNDAKTYIADEVLDVGPGVDSGSHQDVLHKNKTSQVENDLSSKEGSGLCNSGAKRHSKRIKRMDSHETLKRGTKRARSAPVNSPEKKPKGASKGIQPDRPNKPERCKSNENRYSKNKAYDSNCGLKRRRSKRNLQCQPYESGGVCVSDVSTPVKFKAPVNNASPICMGDEYLKQSCKNPSKSFSERDIRHITVAQPMLELKSPRKRRDLGSIHVLFSQHLDENVTNHQRKIMTRLGISEASCITKATHFVADNFVRTRNMLEAIASGKPVVTPLWLDSIGQVKIYIDEEAYILRDTKKEKKFGFSMPFSLAHTRQHPLLQGRRVFITPNTKPGKQTIRTLVKAVHGQAVERLGRSALKDDKLADKLLVLSCEEDFSICVQFLEKGMEVYSSELLLNGIVTQKLEYERHRLFADYVKRTRSTIWLRNNQGAFLPVTSKK